MFRNFLLFVLVFNCCDYVFAQSLMNIHKNDSQTLSIPINSIDSIVFSISNPITLPIISTDSPTFITSNSVISGGNIISDGGSPIIQLGVCWSKQPNPTIQSNKTQQNGGNSNFTCQLGILSPSSTYYTRSYATNSLGTAYGQEIIFKTTSLLDTIISIDGSGVYFDGYNYSSKILGNGQEWMAENLRTSIFSNGDSLNHYTDYMDWYNDSIGAWSYVNEDSSLVTPYGKLYNFYSVLDERNVCPSGWHVPNNEEWAYLLIYLGGDALAGGYLKDTSQLFWGIELVQSTNLSGLSFFPSGRRKNVHWSQLPVGANPLPDYFFSHVGQGAILWSRDFFTPNQLSNQESSFYFSLIQSSLGVYYDWTPNRNEGLAIRCLRN